MNTEKLCAALGFEPLPRHEAPHSWRGKAPTRVWATADQLRMILTGKQTLEEAPVTDECRAELEWLLEVVYPPLATSDEWARRAMEAACKAVKPEKSLAGTVVLLCHSFEIFPPVNAELWEVTFDIELGPNFTGEGATFPEAVTAALVAAMKAGAFGEVEPPRPDLPAPPDEG